MSSWVQLYQTAFANVDANGNLVFKINGPRITRTWLGSLTFIGLPGGSLISVTVGAQAYGQMSAPGPGGLFELLHGIDLVATSTGLAPGLQCTMILAGADFPADQAPPYFGPSLITATSNAGTGGAVPNTNTPHNFSYLGNLTASATTPVPGFFVSTPPGSQSFLNRLWGQLLGGTSVAVQVRRNAYPAYSGAVPITGWNTVTITTTPSGFVLPTDLQVFDLDYIDIVLSSLTGTPAGLALQVNEIVVPP